MQLMIPLQIDRSIPVPLHYQVYRQLREAIREGELKPGDALPPEPDLAVQLDIARGTLRQAIDQLVREGMLRRERGRGTFVSGPPSNLQTGRAYSAAADTTRRDVPLSARLLRQGRETAPARVREVLGLTPGTQVLVIERLRSMGQEPVAYDTIYLPAKRFEGFDAGALGRTPIAKALADQYDVKPDEGVAEVQAVLIEGEPARLLDVPSGSPGFHVERRTLQQGKPVDVRLSLIPGHRPLRLILSPEQLAED